MQNLFRVNYKDISDVVLKDISDVVLKDISDVVLRSLMLTMNRFHTLI